MEPIIKISHGTIPGVAKNMPIIAVKTIREHTLGFVNAKKLFKLSPLILSLSFTGFTLSMVL
jgi:hypothetical protein